MQRITSAKNDTIKRIRLLSTSAKARKEFKQTLFEGVHLSEAYLAAGHEPIYCVVTDSALENKEVVAIVSQLREEECLLIPDSLFASLSTVESGVGVLLVVSLPDAKEASALTTDALLIDGVQDPGNVGALLRTAAASGVKAVYLSKGSASVWAPKTIRAGMGAHMTMEIYEHCDLFELVQQAQVPVRATSLQAKESLYQKDLTVPTAWIMGNEGAGVSEELIKLCGDNTVIIPQDESVESLNVAAAAAVCLFEQRRQRMVK